VQDAPKILSLTALKELEAFHIRAAESYRKQACDLVSKRNFDPIGAPDQNAFMRAGVYLKTRPEFPQITPELCQSVARKFFIDYERFYTYARSLAQQKERQIIEARTRRVVDLGFRGLKKRRIAEMVKLSPARVSQILNPDPDRDAAKSAGLPLATYKRAKRQGRLKSCQ